MSEAKIVRDFINIQKTAQERGIRLDTYTDWEKDEVFFVLHPPKGMNEEEIYVRDVKEIYSVMWGFEAAKKGLK